METESGWTLVLGLRVLRSLSVSHLLGDAEVESDGTTLMTGRVVSS